MGRVAVRIEYKFVGKRSPEAVAEAFRELARLQQERGKGRETADNYPGLPRDVNINPAAGAVDTVSKPEYQPPVLLGIVTDATTTTSGNWGRTARLYRDLLRETYGEENVFTAGVTLEDGIEDWLTQEEFFRRIDEKYREVVEIKRAKGELFFGFSQVHIIGHGVKNKGILFKNDEPFNSDLIDPSITSTRLLHLNPAGKVIIAVCQAKYGTMEKWIGGNLHHYRDEYDTLPGLREEPASAEDIEREAKERVRAVAGDFGVRERDDKPKGWEWHYGTRQIARFLGIEMNMDEVSEAIRAELNEILKSLGKPLVSD